MLAEWGISTVGLADQNASRREMGGAEDAGGDSIKPAASKTECNP